MPRIPRLLGDQGVTFSRAYVASPSCCPSRASIFRGQYPHNHGVLGNTYPNGGFQKFYQRGNETLTVATWLQEAGYRTALVGKYLNNYPMRDDPSHIPLAGMSGTSTSVRGSTSPGCSATRAIGSSTATSRRTTKPMCS